MKTKLTVRVPRDLLENAKRYASAHNTTFNRVDIPIPAALSGRRRSVG